MTIHRGMSFKVKGCQTAWTLQTTHEKEWLADWEVRPTQDCCIFCRSYVFDWADQGGPRFVRGFLETALHNGWIEFEDPFDVYTKKVLAEASLK